MRENPFINNHAIDLNYVYEEGQERVTKEVIDNCAWCPPDTWQKIDPKTQEYGDSICEDHAKELLDKAQMRRERLQQTTHSTKVINLNNIKKGTKEVVLYSLKTSDINHKRKLKRSRRGRITWGEVKVRVISLS